MAIAISPRLLKRIISASIIIPIVVAGILLGGVPFILLVSANAVIVIAMVKTPLPQIQGA